MVKGPGNCEHSPAGGLRREKIYIVADG
jgi:hypothetical protein